MPSVNLGPASSQFPNTVAGYVPNTGTQPLATYSTDASGNVTGLVGPKGTQVLLPLFRKIKAAMAAAKGNNAFENQPWNAAPAPTLSFQT